MEDINVTQLKKRLDQGDSLKLLDVREPYEASGIQYWR